MPPTSLTIGTFDGVHLGHQALVRRCRERVGEAGRVLALAFDPHPMTLLNPQRVPPRILTFARKRELLMQAGADQVVRLEPTTALLDTSARDFVASVLREHQPIAIVEGPDFHFAKGREGTVRVLTELCAMLPRELGLPHPCAVDVLEPVDIALGDHQIVRASSTIVRWAIAHGRMGDAARVLGRWHELEGTVVQGDRTGRTIGIPTCNLATDCMLPADASYAGLAMLPDGRAFPAAVAVGARPTVAGRQRRAEIHLITDDQPVPRRGREESHPLPGLPEYGWPLRVQLRAFLRDEVKFPGLDALLGQIRRDIERIRTLVPSPSVPALR